MCKIDTCTIRLDRKIRLKSKSKYANKTPLPKRRRYNWSASNKKCPKQGNTAFTNTGFGKREESSNSCQTLRSHVTHHVESIRPAKAEINWRHFNFFDHSSIRCSSKWLFLFKLAGLQSIQEICGRKLCAGDALVSELKTAIFLS